MTHQIDVIEMMPWRVNSQQTTDNKVNHNLERGTGTSGQRLISVVKQFLMKNAQASQVL